MFKDCAGALDRLLEMLCRLLSYVSMEWKRENGVPVSEKDNREIVLNYKLVLETSVVCKLIEKS